MCPNPYFPAPAFSVELLKNGRWLLGAGGRATSPFWRTVETVTPAKQALFMARLIFGFSVRRKQVKHVSTARLSIELWEQLVETSCLLQEVLDQMASATLDDGSKMFDVADIEKARRRAVEGTLVYCIMGPGLELYATIKCGAPEATKSTRIELQARIANQIRNQFCNSNMQQCYPGNAHLSPGITPRSCRTW